MSYSETKLKTNSLTIENLTNDAQINVHQGSYFSLSTVYLYVSVWDDPDFVLRAKNAYFNNLTADNALIHNLTSDYIYATQAFISSLSTANIYNSDTINSDIITCNVLTANNSIYSPDLIVNNISADFIDVPLITNSTNNDDLSILGYNTSNNITVSSTDLIEPESRYVEVTPIIKTNYVLQNDRGYTIINPDVSHIYLQDNLYINSIGLNFQYFTYPAGELPNINVNTTVEGTGIHTEGINFTNWGTSGPFAQGEYYGFIWTGWIRPPETGTYTFRTLSDDGIRLYINDVRIIDEWRAVTATQTGINSTPVLLTKNTLVSIKIEYFNYGGPGSIQLRWSSDTGIPEQVIPSSVFSPALTNQTTNEILSSIYIDPPNQEVIQSIYTHVTADDKLRGKTIYLPAGLSTFYIPDDSQINFEIGTYFELKTLLPHTSLFEGTYYNVPGLIQLLSRNTIIIEDQLNSRFVNYSDLTIKYRNYVKITKVDENRWSLNTISPMPPVNIYSRDLPNNNIGEDGDVWYQYYI